MQDIRFRAGQRRLQVRGDQGKHRKKGAAEVGEPGTHDEGGSTHHVEERHVRHN